MNVGKRIFRSFEFMLSPFLLTPTHSDSRQVQHGSLVLLTQDRSKRRLHCSGFSVLPFSSSKVFPHAGTERSTSETVWLPSTLVYTGAFTLAMFSIESADETVSPPRKLPDFLNAFSFRPRCSSSFLSFFPSFVLSNFLPTLFAP